MTRMRRSLLILSLVAAALVAQPAFAGNRVPGGPSTQSAFPLVWQGEAWTGRNSPLTTAQPAPNYWLASPNTTFVDSAGRLHLVAKKIADRWFCAGISTVKSDYGYGTYRFVVETPLRSFDANAVVGMFTYNDSPANGHQEADVELSRWGVPVDNAPNAQYVVQPWTRADHLLRFNAPT